MEKEIMLHNISLSENRQIAPNLWAGRDRMQLLRIHNGEVFRGYATRTRNRKGEIVYGYQVWGEEISTAHRRIKWKTMVGAEKALIAEAIELNPPPPPPPTKLQPACPHCKSTNVSVDSVSTWNVEKAQWEHDGDYGTGGCRDCDKEFDEPAWIEVKDDADNSTTQPSNRTGEAVQQEPVDPAD